MTIESQEFADFSTEEQGVIKEINAHFCMRKSPLAENRIVMGKYAALITNPQLKATTIF